MRRFEGERQFDGSFSAGAVNANIVNFNYFTNVTNVRPCRHGGFGKHVRNGRQNGRLGMGHSNLLGYLYEGRSEGELCKESVRTLGIASRQVGSAAVGMASGIGEMAAGIVSGAVSVLSAMFGRNS